VFGKYASYERRNDLMSENRLSHFKALEGSEEWPCLCIPDESRYNMLLCSRGSWRNILWKKLALPMNCTTVSLFLAPLKKSLNMEAPEGLGVVEIWGAVQLSY
jgi:hypothetical protein